jgi:predicted amidophosphoribosyltransferase
MGATLQPIGHARRGLGSERCADRLRSAQAREGDRSTIGLSRSERATNVQGAFSVSPEGKAAVAGRGLVLVDDVLASGATIDGCARALLRAGAANVDVLVFARVADRVRTSI